MELASQADSSTNMLKQQQGELHQRSPDQSIGHEELGPALASDVQPGVRAGQTTVASNALFRVEFNSFAPSSSSSSSRWRL